MALTALSALLAIAVGLAIDQLIRDLFSRHDWLGWAAVTIAAVAAVSLLAVVVRELWGLSRLRSIEKLRQRGEEAKSQPDMTPARKVANDIIGMFENRPETAHGRALLDEHDDAVMDGADLVHLVERDLLAPLDRSARSMVMQSAKRVSIVTAVSPRALVDIGFVLFENMSLIRRIAEHYGGKPGALSSVRLAREVITHLAATGAIAVGDGLLQQVIGQGLAARLSARLGEGVVNGLLTARIGIAAIDVCRPLKFEAEKRPGISDFVSELVKTGTSR
jgi:putative membrane protein